MYLIIDLIVQQNIPHQQMEKYVYIYIMDMVAICCPGTAIVHKVAYRGFPPFISASP